MNKWCLLSGMLLALAGCADNGDASELGKTVVAIDAERLAALPNGERLTVDLRDEGVVYEIDGAREELDASRIAVITEHGARESLPAYLAQHFPELDLADFFVVLPDPAAEADAHAKPQWRARPVPTMSPDRGYPESGDQVPGG